MFVVVADRSGRTASLWWGLELVLNDDDKTTTTKVLVDGNKNVCRVCLCWAPLGHVSLFNLIEIRISFSLFQMLSHIYTYHMFSGPHQSFESTFLKLFVVVVVVGVFSSSPRRANANAKCVLQEGALGVRSSRVDMPAPKSVMYLSWLGRCE